LKTIFPRKIFLYLLAGIFIIAVTGCGKRSNETGGSSSTSVPIFVDFTTYSYFPEAPWTDLTSGWSSADWSITSAGANFNPQGSDPNDALLSYNSYTDAGVDTSVSGTIMTIASSGQFGLYLWASSDLSTGYYQLIFDIATGSVTINKTIEGGSTTMLASASWTLNDADFHTYKFSLSGSGSTTLTLTGYVDSSSKLQVIDDSGISTSYGYTGFFFNNISNATISAYQITQP